jgi:hypothetical protein
MKANSQRTPQMQSVFALAKAHGHGWATVDVDNHVAAAAAPDNQGDPDLARLAVTAAALAAATTLGETDRAYNEYAKAYIATWDRDPGLGPMIEHRTGTGRLAWSVYHDGSVEINVSRPSGVVFKAGVSGPGTRYLRLEQFGKSIEARHIEALVTALRALLVSDMEIARGLRVAGVGADHQHILKVWYQEQWTWARHVRVNKFGAQAVEAAEANALRAQEIAEVAVY